MLKLTVKGRVPSKKNSLRRIKRGNRIFTVASEQHKDWEEAKLWELKFQKIDKVENIKSIEIVFYAPDKRKADSTNKAESIMDLLVKAKVIEDDNWFVVPDLRLKFGGIDRISPRAEIKIK